MDPLAVLAYGTSCPSVELELDTIGGSRSVTAACGHC